MIRIYKSILFLIIMAGSYQSTAAYNINGGDIRWEYLGNDSFKVFLDVYRECSSFMYEQGSIQATCASTGTSIASASLSSAPSKDATPVCENACSTCSSASCNFSYGVKRYSYVFILDLSSANKNCCLTDLSFEQVYRSTNNDNLNSGWNRFHVRATLNRCEPANSPAFRSMPQFIMCSSEDQKIDFGYTASSVSGSDSVVYELTPVLGYNGAKASYAGKFNYDKPLTFWGFPNAGLQLPKGFHLGKMDGVLKFRPVKEEQAAVAVMASEYKDGKLISRITRDISFIVVSCSNSNNPPGLSTFDQGTTITEICAGDPFTFQITPNDKDIYDTLTFTTVDTGGLPGADFSVFTKPLRDSARLRWTPHDSLVRDRPYMFSFTVTDNNCPVPSTAHATYQVFVRPRLNTVYDGELLNCGMVRLGAASTGGMLYQWYGAQDSLLGTGDTITVQRTANGWFHYTLKVRNNACSEVFSDSLLVNNYTQVQVTLPPDSSICYNDRLTLNPVISPVGPSYNHVWQPGGTTDSFFTVLPLKDTQEISLQITDSGGCTASDTMMVYKHPEIVMSPGTAIEICRNDQPLTLNAQPSGGAWSGPGIRMHQGNWMYDPGSDTMAAGRAFLHYRYMDNNGCVYLDSTSRLLHDPPEVQSEIDTILCPDGDPVMLGGSPAGGQWYGTGVKYVGNTAYFYPQSAAVQGFLFKPRYEYEDTNNCTNMDTGRIELTRKQNLVFDFIPGACPGGDSILLPGLPGGGAWDGDGVMDTAGSYIFDPADPALDTGSNFIFFTFADSIGCWFRDTMAIKISPPPIAAFTASNTSGDIPLVVKFSDQSSGSLNQWKWYFGTDEKDSSKQRNPTFAYTDPDGGSYNVMLIVRDSTTGCVDTMVRRSYITVNPFTGIRETGQHQVLWIYPNPATDVVNVALENAAPVIAIQLMDLQGRIIRNIQPAPESVAIPRRDLKPGTYILRIITDKGTTHHQRVIFR